MLATNPYKIDGPALVSFSGGRTSGYMLHEIIAAHGGSLPSNVVAVFANTGKERPETLDFVQECGQRFGVHVHWLERVPGEHGQRFAEVSHNSASRGGEPFDQLIREKNYLPNPVTRFCTIELKIRVMRDFARSLGQAEARSSKPSGARFRDDRPNYAALLDFTQRQGVLPLNEFDDHQSCDTTCTD